MAQTIEETIRCHLSISHRLHEVAEKVLEAKIGNEAVSESDEVIDKTAKKNMLLPEQLARKVNILQEKYEYIEHRNKVNEAIEEAKTKRMTSVSKSYGLATRTLKKHCFERRKNINYQYDKLVKLDHGIFTYVKEFSMLERLISKRGKTNSDSNCHCQACALNYLIEWAPSCVDKHKKKRFSTDKKKVNWVLEYEMRHHQDIFSNFESIDKCKNVTRASMSEMQPPYDVSQQPGTSHATQLKSSESFQGVSDVLPMSDYAREVSGSVWQQPLDEQNTGKSASHDAVQELSQFLEAFGVLPMSDYARESEVSGSVWQQPLDEQNTGESTSHGAVQVLSQFPAASGALMTDRNYIRNKIKQYLHIDGMMEKAAKEVVDEGKNVEEVVQNYRLEQLQQNLQFKTDIMLMKRYYWKVNEKIEETIKYILHSSEINIKSVAKQRGIPETVLEYEFDKYVSLEDKNLYKFEVHSGNQLGNFTFEEESFLLQQMRFLKDYLRCSCKICVLEYLRNLAYDFAKVTHKRCYFKWLEDKYLNLNWLFLFVIVNTDDISFFEPPSECKIES